MRLHLSKERQLGFLLVCSLFANGALARYAYTEKRLVTLATGVGMEVGQDLPSVTVKDLNGATKVIDTRQGNGTVFYGFAPQCGWCAKNFNNFKAVAAAAKAKGMSFVALSLVDDNVADYVAKNGIDVPVVIVSPQSKSELHLGATPHTFVVGATGRVERTWKGAYTGKTAQEISAFFGTELPGLIDVPKK